MELSFIDGDRLARLVPMSDAIEALEKAFSGAPPTLPDRQHHDVGDGDLLMMPAWSAEAAGVKLVTVAPDNPRRHLPLIHGVYVLFERPALRPIAVFDAAPLTALRTAAVSAVATRHLARPDSSRLIIFGAGVQARAHLLAMHAVLALDTLRVVSRTQHKAQRLVAEAGSLGLDAGAADPGDVADADVVCTCTTSSVPVFDGRLLRPGTHVNAIGSYRSDARELDDLALERARVAVDTDTALRESGDLIAPLRAGVLQEEEIRLLSDVIRDGGRAGSEEITIFKSVGAAFQDLAVAQAALAAGP